jgi:hypothetical protein
MFSWNSYIFRFQLAAPAMRASIVSRSIGWASQCVSRLITPTFPRVRSAMGLAIAYDPHGEFCPMTMGRAPASSTWLTFSSTAACARRMFSTVGFSFASGGIRASPKSTTRRCSNTSRSKS